MVNEILFVSQFNHLTMFNDCSFIELIRLANHRSLYKKNSVSYDLVEFLSRFLRKHRLKATFFRPPTKLPP